MNLFEIAARSERFWKDVVLPDLSGYKPEYTFYNDFTIAEVCQVKGGEKNAIKSTFNEVINSWKGNYKALTEIVIVVNHKSWAWASDKSAEAVLINGSKKNNEIGQLYADLYYKARDLFYKVYGENEEACTYFFDMTD